MFTNCFELVFPILAIIVEINKQKKNFNIFEFILEVKIILKKILGDVFALPASSLSGVSCPYKTKEFPLKTNWEQHRGKYLLT